MNLLVLYDPHATHINTVREHLESFFSFSRNHVYYAPGSLTARCRYNLGQFDAILIHYSVRLCFDWYISPHFAEALSRAKAYKILFIQDEYDCTAIAWRWIREIGVNTVFTCVPTESVGDVYPPEEVPGVHFVKTLTGWVSPELEGLTSVRPLADRTNWINYRGRNLPAWYGDLGREKMLIGARMREECRTRNLPCDIEWSEESRIYGAAWWDFLQEGRATLGSESGSNVFDFKGEIRSAIQRDSRRKPELTYEELHARHIGKEEGRVRMNQVSPRIFEAAALKTGLVLFRGEYSGVVFADVHYIPLEKDFRNVDEVFTRLEDVKSLEVMVRRCHDDVIRSQKYSYRAFVEQVDAHLEEAVGGAGSEISALSIFSELQHQGSPSFGGVVRRAGGMVIEAMGDIVQALSMRWALFKNDPRKTLAKTCGGLWGRLVGALHQIRKGGG